MFSVIWALQSRLDVKIKPKCLQVVTLSIVLSSKKNGVSYSGLFGEHYIFWFFGRKDYFPLKCPGGYFIKIPSQQLCKSQMLWEKCYLEGPTNEDTEECKEVEQTNKTFPSTDWHKNWFNPWPLLSVQMFTNFTNELRKEINPSSFVKCSQILHVFMISK